MRAPAMYLAALQRLNSPMSRRMAIVCMTGAAIFAWIGFITASRTAYGLATFVAQHSDFMSMSYSPELLLAELLIAFALCLAFVAIWSRRSAFVSLVVGVSFYLLVEAVWWSTAVYRAPIGGSAWMHVVTGAFLVCGVILFRRGASPEAVSRVALWFVVVVFGLWVAETIWGTLRSSLTIGESYNPEHPLWIVIEGGEWSDLVMIALPTLSLLASYFVPKRVDGSLCQPE